MQRCGGGGGGVEPLAKGVSAVVLGSAAREIVGALRLSYDRDAAGASGGGCCLGAQCVRSLAGVWSRVFHVGGCYAACDYGSMCGTVRTHYRPGPDGPTPMLRLVVRHWRDNAVAPGQSTPLTLHWVAPPSGWHVP